MRIFMSWSGDRSRAIAEEFKSFLSKVLQQTETFISSQDIELGSLGQNRVLLEVNERRFGLIFITPENKKSEWIHYEAGGLIKDLEKDRVVPILFGIAKQNISPPLSQFQMIEFDKQQVFGLIKQINLATEKPVETTNLSEVFEAFFSKVEEKINSVIADSPEKVQPRTTEDILNELLQLSREQAAFNQEIRHSLRDGPIISKRNMMRAKRHEDASAVFISSVIQNIAQRSRLGASDKEIMDYIQTIEDDSSRIEILNWYLTHFEEST
jgi:hypothetical protein